MSDQQGIDMFECIDELAKEFKWEAAVKDLDQEEAKRTTSTFRLEPDKKTGGQTLIHYQSGSRLAVPEDMMLDFQMEYLCCSALLNFRAE